MNDRSLVSSFCHVALRKKRLRVRGHVATDECALDNKKDARRVEALGKLPVAWTWFIPTRINTFAGQNIEKRECCTKGQKDTDFVEKRGGEHKKLKTRENILAKYQC